jgi:hypothetical protein
MPDRPDPGRAAADCAARPLLDLTIRSRRSGGHYVYAAPRASKTHAAHPGCQQQGQREGKSAQFYDPEENRAETGTAWLESVAMHLPWWGTPGTT